MLWCGLMFDFYFTKMLSAATFVPYFYNKYIYKYMNCSLIKLTVIQLLPKGTNSFDNKASIKKCCHIATELPGLILCLHKHICSLICYFLLHLYISYTVYSATLLPFILFHVFCISWPLMDT